MLAYMGKKVTDGPLAPLGTNRDWMKGETVQGVIPVWRWRQLTRSCTSVR